MPPEAGPTDRACCPNPHPFWPQGTKPTRPTACGDSGPRRRSRGGWVTRGWTRHSQPRATVGPPQSRTGWR
eukprot:scaffold14071_cov105-Isochrysis_galbana.AAC.1